MKKMQTEPNPELVEFRGRQVLATWPKKLEEAQKITHVLFGSRPNTKHSETIVLEREKFEWGQKTMGIACCADCAAKDGEYHVPGCDAETCPNCGGQLISCDCYRSFGYLDEQRRFVCVRV